MILTDLIAAMMMGTWFLTLSEYKDKLIRLGQTAFVLVSITGVGTIALAYIFYSTAEIATQNYQNVVGWYEDVRIEEIRHPSASKNKEIHKFYEIMAGNPNQLTRREYFKLKAQYQSVIHTK